MGWLLANCLLFFYGISPLLFTVLYGVGIVNGGRVFEAISVVLFVLILGGHVTALSFIRRASSPPNTFKLPTICVDMVLFLIHFLITAGGVTFGAMNAINENFYCNLQFDPSLPNASHMGTMDLATDPNNSTPNDRDDNQVNGYCGVDVSFFLLTILVLCVRCWHLPIITTLRTYRKKKR